MSKAKVQAANRRAREKASAITLGAQVGTIGAATTGAAIRRYTDPLPVVGDAGTSVGLALASYALSFAGRKGGMARAALQTAGSNFLGQAIADFIEGDAAQAGE